MTTTIIGFPRFGENRELKFATERYFRREINQTELLNIGKALRKKHWALLASNHITEIPSNDFSFYDTTLDTAVLFNIIPQEVKALGFCQLDTYFALARGYQGEHGDVKALPMKKWFNTNYHYLVPQFEDATEIKVNGTKIFDEYLEAKSLGYNTRPDDSLFPFARRNDNNGHFLCDWPSALVFSIYHYQRRTKCCCRNMLGLYPDRRSNPDC